MKYSLRNQEKIAATYSEEYLKKAIIASLDRLFSTYTDEEVRNLIENSRFFPSDWAAKYYLLPADDVTDKKGDDCQLFAVLGKNGDTLNLAYIGVFRG